MRYQLLIRTIVHGGIIAKRIKSNKILEKAHRYAGVLFQMLRLAGSKNIII
jgi:hypothetical protein